MESESSSSSNSSKVPTTSTWYVFFSYPRPSYQFRSSLQIDRKNKYYLQGGFFFPHYTNKTFPMRDTILDGELVLDTPPGSNHVCSSYILTLSPFLTNALVTAGASLLGI